MEEEDEDGATKAMTRKRKCTREERRGPPKHKAWLEDKGYAHGSASSSETQQGYM
jgi:hypothetical protein